MANSTAPAGWAIRAHEACEWLFWVMTVNILWYLFTLAGGLVLGAAPATVAATELTRRRLRGEAFSALPAFFQSWRREFWRANAVLGPVLAAVVLLGFNVAGFAASGTLGELPGIVSAIAFVVAFSLAAVVAPMYAHYDLPPRAYVLTASRWMLRNLAHVVLLVLAATVITTASLMLPGVIPFLSLGAWLTVDTVLCIAFFTANDRRLAETEPAGAH